MNSNEMADLSKELAEITPKVTILRLEAGQIRAKLDAAERKQCMLQSRLFILANGITKADVEMSSGEGKPWFGHVCEFGKWLAANPVKKAWAEWNHGLHRVSDLIRGRAVDPTGFIEELDQ